MRARRLLVAATALIMVGMVGTGALSARASALELVQNGSLEGGSGDSFTCFGVGGWGDRAVTLTATAGRTGRAARLVVSNWTSGDAKLLTTQTDECAAIVEPDQVYRPSLYYHSTAPVTLTVFRHSAAGWTYWTDLITAPATPAFTRLSTTTPPVPAGTDRLSFGLGLAGNGEVVTDDYSLTEPTTSPPPAAAEMINNGALSMGGGSTGSSQVPSCFQQAGWGDAAVTAVSSADTRSGKGRSWSLTLAHRSTGDHKLLQSEEAGCAPAVIPGTVYTASVWYKSTGTSHGLTFFSHTSTGWGYWTDLATLPAAATWTRVTATLPPIPSGVDRISFGVSLGTDGTLLTDDYSLVQGTEPLPDTPWTGLAATGRWSVLSTSMPARAIHATLLRDGRVLLIAGSGNAVEEFNAGTLRSSVWDPVANTFTDIPVPEDFFCAGHVTLPDGRVLIMGGTKEFPGTGNPAAQNFQGLASSYVFDPATDSYLRVNDAHTGHWYPTLTKLENGNVWAAGGLDEHSQGSVATEMYDSHAQRWMPPGDGQGQVPQTYSYWGTYPHMFLLDDGRLFYTGGHTFGNNIPGTGARLYDWRTKQMWDVPGLRDKEQRDQAGSVLLPPAQLQQAMIVGGGHTEAGLPGVTSTDLIDLSRDNPTYTNGPDLPGPGKLYLNLVNLPDRTVLAANGATQNRSDNVHSAAIFDPVASAWTEVAYDPIGRNYHSAALLLPDGRVAVFGSNPADNSFEQRISVYEPPYLFRGERPVVSGAPMTVRYGASFDLNVDRPVRDVSLVSPGSSTHQTDTNARLVDVPFTLSGGGTLHATVTSNKALLPPGPYLMFVTTDEGAVSTGKWVMVS